MKSGLLNAPVYRDKMSQNFPKFSKPPLVEAVIGVQFAPLAKYSSAFAGWFWKSVLDSSWTQTCDAPRLEDVFEKFDEPMWAPPQIRFKSGWEGGRTQIINAANDRMIQIQSSKFFLNWRKQPDKQYPSYDTLLPEFLDLFNRFRRFSNDSGLGEIDPNGWELTYVNVLQRGEVWNSPKDLSDVLPSVQVPDVPGANAETISGDWRYSIEKRCRLYISLRHGKLADNSEGVQLQLVARGGVDAQTNLDAGLDLGHRTNAHAFAAITSAGAQARWGRII
jgi:uncharacterized protein (TIGR04255 family)